MLSAKQQYGTLPEQTVEVKRSVSKYAIAFAAVALVTVGIVALSTTSAGHANAAVDSNRYRKQLAPVDPEVREVALKVLNMTVYGLRWAVFGFNKEKSMMIPLTAGPATNDWDKDFKMFTNALPEQDAAVAVYNFEYWVSDEMTATEPIMVTWAPKGMDPAEYARAGYYLGNIILELNTDEGRIKTTFNGGGDAIGAQKKGFAVRADAPLSFSGPYRLDSISDSYVGFCQEEMGLAEKDCNLEKGFHNCPFESEEPEEWTEANPCKKEQCDGASFQNPAGAGADSGTIPQVCCDYITKEFCSAPENAFAMGCHPVTLTAIDKLCEIPKPAEPVKMFTTPGESSLCDEECVQPCTLFEDINDTWRKCEGCNTDLTEDENGQVSQCYPGAYKYEMNTCCGIALDAEGQNTCGKDEYLFSEMCNLMEYYDCKWIPAIDCPEEQTRQTRESAPKGACSTPVSDFEAPLFGTDATCEEDIPQVDCGGGLYAAEDDISVFAAPVEDEAGDLVVQTCGMVGAAAQALKDAYDAEQAALLAVTTAAPARV